MSRPTVDRRTLLAAGGGALGLGFLSTRAPAAARSADEPALRAAHVTDTHVYGNRDAPAGAAAMFRHMADAAGERGGPPDLVLHTGDVVMEAAGNTAGANVLAQLELWQTAAQGSPAELRYCLGNHDMWGGNAPTAGAPAEKAGWRLTGEALGVPHPWYAFEAGGWRFVTLSSAWPEYGTLGEEQFAWLQETLADTPADVPVCVLSHFPILSVTSSVYGNGTRDGNALRLPGSWQHADCWRISEVFREHPNVKLCLSGHMHTRDRCEYRGVWYVCGGAVSGAWWNGAEYGFDPCYAALDLFADGTFDYRFVDYGWPARQWRGKRLEDVAA